MNVNPHHQLIKKNFNSLPAKIQEAIRHFCHLYKRIGFDCYLVGGSCRDLLFDEAPHDYDFATNCPLSKSKTLFHNVITVGESHGTLIIPFHGFLFEITRFRKDISTDGRKAVIAYSDSIEEDQQRRDLRLNALAYDVIDDRLVDSQLGLTDFEEKMIRFVGRAEERIREDHLRALRYARLIAKLLPKGFNYDPDEMSAVIAVFDSSVLSVERLLDELGKILVSGPAARPFLKQYLPQLKIFSAYLPDRQTEQKVLEWMIETGSLLPLPLTYRKHHPLRQTCERFKLSRQDRRRIEFAFELSWAKPVNTVTIKSVLSKTNLTDQTDLIKTARDLLDTDTSEPVVAVIMSGEPYKMKDLALKGKDLLQVGITGEEIGRWMKTLLRAVWREPSLNTRENLMRLLPTSN
jgi:tRNA nucleotidyltransferase/poly(A) polymerase